MRVLPSPRTVNPMFGSSVTDHLTVGNENWIGLKEYHNLTIAAGHTVSFDDGAGGSMRWGPLIIVVRGRLTVAGSLLANGRGERWCAGPDVWGSNGANGSNCQGVMSAAGMSVWSKDGGDQERSLTMSGFRLVPCSLGGGGGGGSQGAGSGTVAVPWSPGTAAAKAGEDSPYFTQRYVPGGAQGAHDGGGGDTYITGSHDRSFLVNPLLGVVGVGVGGGNGGIGDGFTKVLGASSGGTIIILAREVVVLASGIIQANGTVGVAGAAAGKGGAGGGGGGCVAAVCESYQNAGTVEAAGGVGGAAGTGAECGAGGAGSDGVVKIMTA